MSRLISLWVSAVLGIAAADSVAALEDRWNVVLLMAEDMSPRIGPYGDSVAHTPNLNRLASEGTRYTHAFTTAGVCAPSRAAILMGVHQNHWGAGHMRAYGDGGYVAVPPPNWKAFPELLRAAGYYVVNNGKTDYQMGTTLGGAYGGPESIWDEPRAEDWRGRPDGQPFFAYISFLTTHESQVWPTWDLTSFTKIAMAFLRIPTHWRWEDRTDPASILLPSYYPDTPTVRADLARHYNNIAVMDTQVGNVLQKLEDDGIADRTLVIFTSDHGDGLPRAKRWLYDSGIRVPLIVRWPGQAEPDAVAEELVSGVDLAPTILAAAGIEPPDWMEGRVFVGPNPGPEPPHVFAARDRINESLDRVRAVRDRRFKYVRHLIPDQPYVLDGAFRDQMPMMKELRSLAAEGKLDAVSSLWFRERRDAEELFDTDADPEETRNLARDPAYRHALTRMRSILDARLATKRDLGLLPESQLAERFWPDGKQPTTYAPRFERRNASIHIACDTPGASILWKRPSDAGWRLYTAPINVEGKTQIWAKAVRYGFKQSATVRL